jgi:hypothetical protein
MKNNEETRRRDSSSKVGVLSRTFASWNESVADSTRVRDARRPLFIKRGSNSPR